MLVGIEADVLISSRAMRRDSMSGLYRCGSRCERKRTERATPRLRESQHRPRSGRNVLTRVDRCLLAEPLLEKCAHVSVAVGGLRPTDRSGGERHRCSVRSVRTPPAPRWSFAKCFSAQKRYQDLVYPLPDRLAAQLMHCLHHFAGGRRPILACLVECGEVRVRSYHLNRRPHRAEDPH
jgi:hypothetical protein